MTKVQGHGFPPTSGLWVRQTGRLGGSTTGPALNCPPKEGRRFARSRGLDPCDLLSFDLCTGLCGAKQSNGRAKEVLGTDASAPNPPADQCRSQKRAEGTFF